MPLSRLTGDEVNQLIRGTAVATWSMNREGHTLQPEQWTALTGQTFEQMLGNGWLNAVHPDDRERVIAAWSTSLSHGQHFNTDYRIRCVDGAYRWFNVRGVPLRSPTGEIDRWIGLILETPHGWRFREMAPDEPADLDPVRPPVLYPGHVRAARALLDWSAGELSRRCGLSISTIRRFEQGDGTNPLRARNSALLVDCFRQAGVTVSNGGDGSIEVKWSGHPG